MKKKRGVLLVEKYLADEMERICEEPDSSVKKDGVEFDEEFTFDDGMRMAIQVCSTNDPSNESCWTQGVLFDSDGYELGFTEVGESFLGEYCVEFEGCAYIVTVGIK